MLLRILSLVGFFVGVIATTRELTTIGELTDAFNRQLLLLVANRVEAAVRGVTSLDRSSNEGRIV